MIGYTIFDKSMNGIKTLTDGISNISNGKASHNNIEYNDFIKSNDNKTLIINNKITTENIQAQNLQTDILQTNNITSNTGTINNLNCTNLNVDNGFEVSGDLNTITSNFISTFNKNITLQSSTLNLYSSDINQTGTTSNILKDTLINGTLTLGSDIIQSGGNTILKNITCDSITMNTNNSINQNGSSISNNFGTSTINNLTVLGTLTLPSNTNLPATNYTDDITMNSGARIIQNQTYTGTNYNSFIRSNIKGIDLNGNIIQSSGNSTLLNTIIQGTAQIQGDITQTSGSSIMKAITCEQLTLNSNKDLYFLSGTGKINQSLITSGINNLMTDILMNKNCNISMSGTGIISQYGTGTNNFKNSIINGTLDVTNITSLTDLNVSGTTTSLNGNITNLTCNNFTNGTIDNSELNTLDNNNINIKNKFDALDAQIANLTSSDTNANFQITGISYINNTDTTFIDNNLSISTLKNTNCGPLSCTSFTNGTISNTELNTLDNNTSNIKTKFDNYDLNLSGLTYNTNNDTTTIDNNLTVNKVLIVNGMDVKAEIDALDISLTTGTINSTNAIIQTLTTNNINFNINNSIINNFGGSGSLGFVNNTQFNNTNDLGYSFWQAYAGNPNYPLFKYNFRNNGQMLLYNNNNQVLFSVTGNSGIQLFNNENKIFEVTSNGVINASTANITNINTTLTSQQNQITTNATNFSTLSYYLNTFYQYLYTFTGSLQINNNISCDGTIDNNLALKTYQNQIFSTDINEKTSGTIDVLVATFVIKSNYNKIITVSSPISVYKTFNNISANSQLSNRMYDTLSSVTYKVMKNNVLFISGTCTYTDTLPKTIYLVKASSTTIINFECYMTNAIMSFLPSDEYIANGNEYKILYTMNYSTNNSWQSYNLNIISNGCYVNTDQTTSNLTLTLNDGTTTYQSYGSNYSSASYTISKQLNYFTGTGEIKCNELTSNDIYNQNNIFTNTLTSTNLTTTNLTASNLITTQSLNSKYSTIDTYFTARNITAAYLIDGSISSRPIMYPIVCSTKNLHPNDTDDSYIVNAGYKIITYYDANYSGTSNTYDNTNGATIAKYNIVTPNQTSSLRVYFLNNEITLGDIS